MSVERSFSGEWDTHGYGMRVTGDNIYSVEVSKDGFETSSQRVLKLSDGWQLGNSHYLDETFSSDTQLCWRKNEESDVTVIWKKKKDVSSEKKHDTSGQAENEGENEDENEDEDEGENEDEDEGENEDEDANTDEGEDVGKNSLPELEKKPQQKERFDFKSASGVWYNEGKQMKISECAAITIGDQQFSAIHYNFKDDKFYLEHKESCFLQQHSASELLFSDEQEDGFKLRLTRKPGLGGSYQNGDEKTEGIPTEKLLKLDEIEKSKLLNSPEIPHKLGELHYGVTLKFANGDHLLCGRQAQLDDAEETLRVILSNLKYEILKYTNEFCGRILQKKHEIKASIGVMILEHDDRNKLILIGEDIPTRFARDLIEKELNQVSPFSNVDQQRSVIKPPEDLMRSVHYYKNEHSSLQTVHNSLISQHAKMANEIKTLKHANKTLKHANKQLYESNESAERQKTENYVLRQTVKEYKKKLKAVAKDKRELGLFSRLQADDLNNIKEQCKQLDKRLKGAHGELDRARKELTDTRDELARSKRITSEHLSNTHKLMLIDDEGKHQQTSVISGEFPLTSEIIQSFDNLKVDTRVNFFEFLDDNITDEKMDSHKKRKLVHDLFITSVLKTREIAETIQHDFCKSLFMDELNPSSTSFLTNFLQANYQNTKLFDPKELAKDIANSDICNEVLQIVVEDDFRAEFVGFIEHFLSLSWTLRLSSPPLVLGDEKNLRFDESKHERNYGSYDAKNGDEIAYFMWPSLETQDSLVKKALVFVGKSASV